MRSLPIRSHRSSRVRRRTALLFAPMVAALFATAAHAVTTERVSVSSAEAEGDAASQTFSISLGNLSDDGRIVVFASDATNLAPSDGNAATDIFARDRWSGSTERISVDGGGNDADGASGTPSVTADGRYVVFSSAATDLVAGDTNGFLDVFVRDRQNDTTERVSIATGGAQGDADSFFAAISDDGRFVAFASDATNLVIGDANGAGDIFVHDRQNDTTERVSVDSVGTEADAGSERPSLSADGRYVLFRSSATNLVSGDGNGVADAFVHDRDTDVTERVSVDSAGVEGDAITYWGDISDDGRFAAFHSAATNLVGSDTNAAIDVFVRDRQNDTTERVSIATGGAEATGDSQEPSVSDDGRYVSFWSDAADLIASDANAALDVFLRDRQAGTTARVSLTAGGAEAGGDSRWASVSGDGGYVAFSSDASDLVPADGNGVRDAFLRVRFTCGNNVVEPGEQCDDGNLVDGDCCSSFCWNEADGSSCDDGLFCNGADQCDAGACDDHAGDPCAGPDGDGDCSETCDEGANACTGDDPDGSACDDALFCNGADQCDAGVCDDHTGDPCVGPDGDGDCSESCDEGANDCAADDPNGSACNDGLFCNGADQCDAGACDDHAGDPCAGPDGDGDCSETCDEGADNCTAEDPNGSTCDDGLFCNGADQCDAGTCDDHAGDPCAGPDGDGDCSETCDEGVNACTGADPNGSVCDDGLFCTGADQCDAGTCGDHTGDPCTGPDGDVDCSETCDEGANSCTGADPDGSACDDGLFCNGADLCALGACNNHLGDPCAGPDGDGNCAETCDEGADNCAANDLDGSACDDGVFCNGADQCNAGTCDAHAGDPCIGGMECADSCDELGEDCNEPGGIACADDGNACTLDECNGLGSCVHPAGNAGATCRPAVDDCDIVETCTGASAACPADGADPDGTACDDGDGCSMNDECTAGVCGGDPLICPLCEACGESGSCVPAPRDDCKLPADAGRSRLSILDASQNAKDSISWRWLRGDTTVLEELGNPLSGDDYAMCIYAGPSETAIFMALMPAGGTCGTKPCWSLNGTDRGYKYSDKAGTPHGAQKADVKVGEASKAKAGFKGKGTTLAISPYGMPSPELGLPVRAQLQSTGGSCFEATFSTPNENASGEFKSKSD